MIKVLSNILIGVLLFLMCTNEYNPFEDTTNANMHIIFPVGGVDSVIIFSTFNVTLTSTVSELIDSFSIHAEKNRYWTDTTVVSVTSENYKFSVSLTDTGWSDFKVTTYRDDGDQTETILSLYTSSPLSQDDISTSIGAICTLSTDPVGDSILYYNWSYGTDIIDTIQWEFHEYVTSFDMFGTHSGLLWVSDSTNTHSSPAVGFSLTISDNMGPVILCSDSIREDTVITGDPTFVFEVLVVDEGGVKSVDIDNTTYPPHPSSRYRSIFSDMTDYELSPISVEVSAVDNNDNVTDSTFYLLYDPNMPSTYSTSIDVSNILDTVITTDYVILGTVKDYSSSIVNMTASINSGVPTDTQEVDIVDFLGEWALGVTLDTDFNTVKIIALDTLGNNLAEETVNIFHNPDAEDVKLPVITDVKVNGAVAVANRENYIRDSVAEVSFIAFDESGISSALVNGSSVSAESGEYTWRAEVSPVSHSEAVLVSIVITDESDNSSKYEFLVRRNFMPSMADSWEWPPYFIAGEQYDISLDISDDDDDSVRIVDAPAGMSLEKRSGPSNWAILWNPDSEDTGTYRVKVILDDGFQDTSLIWDFDVIKDPSLLVSFETSEDDFPRFLEVGKTFLDTLKVKAGTGKPPYRYIASFTNSDEILLDTVIEDTSPVLLRWIPEALDTGNQHLMVMVIDDYGDSDVLYRDIEVVPKNSDPCSLQVHLPKGVDTTQDGEIDLRGADRPVVITFNILDDDHPYTEDHTISIDAPGEVSFGDDSLTCDITIFPTVDKQRDTISITVSDRTGSVSYLRIPVLYIIDSPEEIDNLKSWHDYESLEYYGGSGDVQQGNGSVERWTGKLEGSYTLTSTGVQYINRAVNNYPAVRLNGENNFLVHFEEGGWIDSAFTVFFIACLRDDASTERNNFTLLSSSPYDYSLFGMGVTGNRTVGIFNRDESSDSITPPDISAGSNLEVDTSWHIFTYRSYGIYYESGSNLEENYISTSTICLTDGEEILQKLLYLMLYSVKTNGEWWNAFLQTDTNSISIFITIQ